MSDVLRPILYCWVTTKPPRQRSATAQSLRSLYLRELCSKTPGFELLMVHDFMSGAGQEPPPKRSLRVLRQPVG